MQSGRTDGRRCGYRSHVVVKEERDPIRGIIQEQEALQEPRQEGCGLLYEHGQKHPGGRLVDSTHKAHRGPDLSLPHSPGRPATQCPRCQVRVHRSSAPEAAQPPPCLHLDSPHLPPRECPPVLVAESTASLGSPAIGDIVPQVVELELLGQG